MAKAGGGTRADEDALSCRIDLARVGQQHVDVLLVAQDPADRRRDVAGRQRRGGHLVQERLKEMVVVAIEQRDARRRAGKRPRRVQSAEAAADDHYMRHCENVIVAA